MSGFWSVRRVGNIRVCFGGALCFGPDYAFMIATMLLIVVCSLLFLIYTTLLGARVVCGCGAVVTLGFMFRCATIDPGICPKDASLLEGAPPREAPVEEVFYVDAHGREQHASVERKWCYCCNNYRPLRAIHCRFCDVCIARRDHHCPWVGTCVGERNYRFYFLFLWSTLCLTLTVLTGGIWSLVGRMKALSREVSYANRSAFLGALAETHFVEPLLVLVAIVTCCLVFPLVAYHTMLVARNMTTVEEMRRESGQVHYYDRGYCLENMKASLCAPIPPSNLAQLTRQCTSSMNIVVETAEV
ncbi:putative palmitoyl acyltransferase 8 [Trypanosoma cruzi]|uniref:Palmitoyltransferase n=1 Tax=Trypanosoma cruzi TaxID=5693 RepID=A0A2V2VK61_TRYCR|nr:putative palmitoyl acyltransferase 10 [Trypanosoma cruzi]PWU96066.1 putative palmitoyl acyltransferase 8 [Trypanosoma cruzi]